MGLGGRTDRGAAPVLGTLPLVGVAIVVTVALVAPSFAFLDRTVLVSREVDDRSEVGDFIADYTFDSGGGPLEDRSGNGNDGTINGDPTRTSNGPAFDGTDDYVTVPDLDADVDVSAFTVAVAYERTGNSGAVNQLVEHRSAGGSEWFLETSPDTGESYTNRYSVAYAVEYPGEVASSGNVSVGSREVVVGTYDGSEYELYVDGERIENGTHSESVEMGELRIARDYELNNQHFAGEMSELGLYYTALDGTEIEQLTRAME